MKKALKAAAVATLLASATAAQATPSTTFWTPATTYVQPYAVPHNTDDTNVAERGLLQNDYGLTVGFLPFEKLQGEVGIDMFLPGGPQLVTGIGNPPAVRALGWRHSASGGGGMGGDG